MATSNFQAEASQNRGHPHSGRLSNDNYLCVRGSQRHIDEAPLVSVAGLAAFFYVSTSRSYALRTDMRVVQQADERINLMILESFAAIATPQILNFRSANVSGGPNGIRTRVYGPPRAFVSIECS